MKLGLLTWLLCIGFIQSPWAQATGSASIQNESQNNQILLNNAAESQKVKTTKVGTIEMNRRRGEEENKILNLTDQEKQLSENFVHQGQANRLIEENCNKDAESRAICAGRSGKHKFMGMDPSMVQMLSKAYAMVGAMGDIGDTYKGTGAFSTKAAEKNGQPEKAKDYCKYIPTVTEGIAQFQQQASQQTLNEIPVQADTEQRAALEKAAKSHEERSKQSQMLAVGWYGGAACYATRMATGGIVVDWSSGLKLAAATFLGTFYQNEVDAHKEYASKVRAVAEKLPGKGDCNPITDRLCYCSEPSTENDPTYCLKEMHKKAVAKNSTRTSCVTDEMKTDPQCKCEATDSCFDKYILTESGVELGLNSGFANTPFKGIRDLVRGELKGGTISNEAYSGAMATAKRTLQDIASKLPDDGAPPPSGEKRNLYNELVKRGVPGLLANKMMGTQVTGSDKYAAKFQGGALAALSPGAAGLGTTGKGGQNVLEFSGGAGLKLGSGGNVEDKADDLDLSKFGAPTAKKGSQPQGKVINFLNQATQRAAISKKDQMIFEIISNRYQTSGRKRLEIEGD